MFFQKFFHYVVESFPFHCFICISRWSKLQACVDFNPKLGVCLQLGSSLPSNLKRLTRWFGERFRALILPENLWRSNRGGYPVLPGPLKNFVTNSYHIPEISYLLSSRGKSFDKITEYKNKFLYLLHLYREYYKTVVDPDRRRVMRVMADFPIRPLQPLRDDLTQEIYAVFEADPIKYRLYFDATLAALKDMQEAGSIGTEKNPVVMMVVGAGRGPVVTEAVRAAYQLKMKFKASSDKQH